MVVKNSRFETPRAAYVHVPFCRHRCGYCNFTVVAGRDDLIDSYLEAIATELSWLDRPREVETLYVGGGTPTHLPAVALHRFLALIREWFPLAHDFEFSVEANPADVTRDVAASLAEFGVNRISLGVQSFLAGKLSLLERDHRASDIHAAVEAARLVCDNISLDLIFGVPGESFADWTRDLDSALQVEPTHLSTYGLTFEKGTRFWGRLRQGGLRQTAEELEVRMYQAAIERLAAAGWEHYEVSSFARPGYRCRHNEAYWTGQTYYAIGPGAARHVDGRREANHRSTSAYLKRVSAGRSPVAESEMLSDPDAARERLVFGLRRLEGVDKAEFLSDTGFDIDELGGETLRQLAEQGMIADTGQRVRLTRHGLLVSDSVLGALLTAW